VLLTPPKNLLAVSLTPLNIFSAASTTPAINFTLFGYLWPVSTTPGKNVIAGVVFTGDNCSPVSLILAKKIHSRLSQPIFEKSLNDPNGILGARGTLINEKKIK
jgi:hypothetical protein